MAALAIVSIACQSRQAEPAPKAPDPLLGRWSLRYDPPLQGRLGTRLILALDSVRADSVFGAVEMMFGGDVGVDPAIFDALRGTRNDSTISLLVPPAERQRLRLELRGTLGADTIVLSSFRMGMEETLGEGAPRVLLVKEIGL